MTDNTAPTAIQAPVALRVCVSIAALVAAFVLADLVIQGRPLAPRYTLLGALPMAPIALAHALAVLAGAWWPRPEAPAGRALAAVVLFGGILVVAAGADAAFVQVRFWMAEARAFDSYRLVVGGLTALNGALGVVLVWARRAPVLKRPVGAIRIRRFEEM